jgi:hypothetical protein
MKTSRLPLRINTDTVISRVVLVAGAIAALALSGCGATQHAAPTQAISRTASPRRAASEYVDRGYAYHVRVPAGWSRAHQSLTPSLVDPREILTVATFPLRLRGGLCAQNPGALADMGARDVLVTIQERAGTPGPEFVARPKRFTAGMGFPSEATECVRHPTFSARLIDFRDGPRFFHAIVAIGKSAPADARRAGFAVLDSLRFGPYTPRWPPASSPLAPATAGASAPGSFVMALPSSSSLGNGLSVSYPHGWHLFAPPITSLSYPYDRMLITSYPAVTGGDCGPTRAESALPSNGALIYLLEYSGASDSVLEHPMDMAFPAQSTGFRLRRGDLADYECWTVPSYLMRFSAAGRLFQVHLAFGASATANRRAQALRILSSLRVRALAQSISRRAVPRTTRSPGRSSHRPTRSPLTNVPFRDPRS